MTRADRLLFHETERIERAAVWALERLGGQVASAVILGSGFHPLMDLLDNPLRTRFSDVPGLGACSAPGHAGELVAGTIGGARHLFFSGRFHLYEGRSGGEVASPVALARALGADRILLTCAAGATSDRFSAGDLVLIEDHINLTGENPLLGVPVAERRSPFLPMGDAYDHAAIGMADRAASALPGGARRGVLAALTGPSFETPAEYRALARLGADLVSMSVALETIAARWLGLRVLALAIVANGPAKAGEPGTAGEEVLEVVEAAVRSRLGYFGALLEAFAAYP